jgi:hypothetical protein
MSDRKLILVIGGTGAQGSPVVKGTQHPNPTLASAWASTPTLYLNHSLEQRALLT